MGSLSQGPRPLMARREKYKRLGSTVPGFSLDPSETFPEIRMAMQMSSQKNGAHALSRAL